MASFGHAPRREPGPPGRATRQLCAAAYDDQSFAEVVLDELVGSRRAVARSVDVDLEPVIWHSLRARRLELGRDLALSAILIAGLGHARAPLIVTVTWAFVMRILYPGKLDRLPHIGLIKSMLCITIVTIV